MIYKGVTTVENLKIENDPENPDLKKNKPESLQETLGANVLTWFIPTGIFLIKISFWYKFLNRKLIRINC